MSTRRAARNSPIPRRPPEGHRCADSGQVEPLKPAGREDDVVRKLSAGDGGHDPDRIEEKEIERERGEEENGQKPHAAADLVQEVGRQSRGAAPGVWGRRVGAEQGRVLGHVGPFCLRGRSCGTSYPCR